MSLAELSEFFWLNCLYFKSTELSVAELSLRRVTGLNPVPRSILYELRNAGMIEKLSLDRKIKPWEGYKKFFTQKILILSADSQTFFTKHYISAGKKTNK